MKHLIDHDLDLPTAKKVTERAFAEYSAQFAHYEPTMRWINERKGELSFNAKGIRLTGTMEILEKAIALDLDVPFLLRPFQKKAIEVIEREVRVWIGKAHAGQI